jgi:hypothetical protein
MRVSRDARERLDGLRKKKDGRWEGGKRGNDLHEARDGWEERMESYSWLILDLGCR